MKSNEKNTNYWWIILNLFRTKNNLSHSLLVGLSTSGIVLLIELLVSYSGIKRNLSSVILGTLLPLILTFSVGVLLIKYNSYKDAFISGLKASALTSMLLFVSTLFYVEVLDRITLKDFSSSEKVEGFFQLIFSIFILLLILSSLLPFISAKHWGKVDNSVMDENVLDS